VAAGATRRAAAEEGLGRIAELLAGAGLSSYEEFQNTALPAEVARREELSDGTPVRPGATGDLRVMLDSVTTIATGLDSWMSGQQQLAELSASLKAAGKGLTQTLEDPRLRPERIAALDPRKVVVGISNRHVHLCDADFKTLFGYDAPKVKKMVRQRGEFAAEETVTLHGPRGTMTRVRVMGPNRPATQVELSRTDCFALGIKAPMAQSGHLETAAPVRIEGPLGSIDCDHAVIVAGRHIHMSPDNAAALNLKDQDRVSVRFGGERGARLDNFLIRVKDSYLAELHLDTDEGNAVGARTGDYVTICLDR